jgi:uncharacterized protein (DUF488 family)
MSSASSHYTESTGAKCDCLSHKGRQDSGEGRERGSSAYTVLITMRIYTLGFTRKSAQEFFDTLKRNNIKQIVDIRLNNISQLAGFTKRDNLKYFLRELCGVDYYHFDFLAPTKEIRDKYAKSRDWDIYAREYIELLESRSILDILDKSFFDRKTCFLCSEASPDHCHRRLLTQYLEEHWGDIEVLHL